MDSTKIIAGIIFGPFLLFPILASVYFAYDRGEILLNSNWETGVVIACTPERASSRSKGTVRSKRSSTVYRANVQSESNVIVKASLAPAKSKQCKKNIGKTVRVLIHHTRPERSRINTFFQFWMIPCIFWFVSAAFLTAIIKGRD